MAHTKISHVFRDLRDELGFTQVEMAEKLGMSIGTLKLYESGQYDNEMSREGGKYLKRLEKLKADLSAPLIPIKEPSAIAEISDLKKRVTYLEDQMRAVMKLVAN